MQNLKTIELVTALKRVERKRTRTMQFLASEIERELWRRVERAKREVGI